MAGAAKRYAVVTGANKGIGFEICRQLASRGFTALLGARNEKMGLEALEKMKQSGVSDNVVFYQLDVTDPASVASLADFVKTEFGKLDVLVNNAAVGSIETDPEVFRAEVARARETGSQINWAEILKAETSELSQDCVNTNYYGPKRMSEALLPFLQLSDSPRIVNVSSSGGKLKNVTNEWAKAVLNNVESLTEEKVDEVLNEYLKDHREGALEARNWPSYLSAYNLSKAALNAYTRILANKHPDFCINALCPGYVNTDINYNTGYLTPSEAAEAAVRLALLPNGGPSGRFYSRMEEQEF